MNGVKKICALLLLLLLCAGCANQVPVEWSACRLNEGDPDVYIFCRNEKWGLADSGKKVLIEAKYEEIIDFEGSETTIARLEDGTAAPMNVSGIAV